MYSHGKFQAYNTLHNTYYVVTVLYIRSLKFTHLTEITAYSWKSISFIQSPVSKYLVVFSSGLFCTNYHEHYYTDLFENKDFLSLK